METREITIRVNAEAAHLFETLSDEQRRKVGILLSLKLREVIHEQRTLEEIMDTMSARAEERGLTPAILESILHGE